jgi:tRNA A-37 threonylcarbamoyl transferase component Bud32
MLRLTHLHRLVRLHKSGVQHNDLEPRNVTQSSSGPLIIDFDRASLDHNCPGALCKELQQVAQALDLDPGERYLAYISLADLVA